MDIKSFIKDRREQLDVQEISREADLLFEERLKSRFHIVKVRKLQYLKYVSIAASVIVLIGLGVAYKTSIEQKNDKLDLMAKLSESSTAVRLEGIYQFEEDYVKEDNQIINTLISLLQSDTNDNVKIATIDALLKFPNNETIRQSFLQALKKEKSPLVQIKLIQSLSLLRETRAIKILDNLINNEEELPVVISNASMALVNLTHKKKRK